jgi:hypothetical protein
MHAANLYDIRRATEEGTSVLTGRRLHRRAAIACALVCSLVAPAISSAQDGRDSVPTSSLAGTTSATAQGREGVDLPAEVRTSSLAGTTSAPSQDLRSPDTRDAASGRSTLGAPDVPVVKLPQPAPVRGNPRIDSGHAIGAMVAMIVLGLAGAMAIARRRRRGPRTATAA